MKIMICGSGTMGRGIALVSILSGHSALLFDKNLEALNQAKSFIDAQLKKSLDK
jgi:3-hydroxybutyryl-CoA dehydrogenase